jgi:hypothetical protein
MSIAVVRSLVPAVALITLLWPRLGVAASPTTPPITFATEKEAEQHCPADLVVWLDLSTRTY